MRDDFVAVVVCVFVVWNETKKKFWTDSLFDGNEEKTHTQEESKKIFFCFFLRKHTKRRRMKKCVDDARLFFLKTCYYYALTHQFSQKSKLVRARTSDVLI